MLGALAVGMAFGYGSQRGAFCMSSGLRGVLDGEWTKVKALGLAVAIQLVLLPVVFAAGLARPAELPLKALAAVAGGVLFGASMRWAGGCAAGVWYKLGAGDIGSLLAVLGMALGASAADAGPLRGVRTSLQEAIPAVSWSPPAAASVGAGLLVLAGLFWLADGRAGAWSWRKTGLWIGIVAAIAWPVSAVGRPRLRSRRRARLDGSAVRPRRAGVPRVGRPARAGRPGRRRAGGPAEGPDRAQRSELDRPPEALRRRPRPRDRRVRRGRMHRGPGPHGPGPPRAQQLRRDGRHLRWAVPGRRSSRDDWTPLRLPWLRPPTPTEEMHS